MAGRGMHLTVPAWKRAGPSILLRAQAPEVDHTSKDVLANLDLLQRGLVYDANSKKYVLYNLEKDAGANAVPLGPQKGYASDLGVAEVVPLAEEQEKRKKDEKKKQEDQKKQEEQKKQKKPNTKEGETGEEKKKEKKQKEEKKKKKEETKQEEQNKEEEQKKKQKKPNTQEEEKEEEKKKKAKTQKEEKKKEELKKKKKETEEKKQEDRKKRKEEREKRQVHDVAGGLKRARGERDGLRRAAVSSLRSMVLPVKGSATEVCGAALVTTYTLYHGGGSNDYEQTVDLREVDCDPVWCGGSETAESNSPWCCPPSPEPQPLETPVETPERDFWWWEWLSGDRCEEWLWCRHKGWTTEAGARWERRPNGQWYKVNSV